jgi:hypothetical protein
VERHAVFGFDQLKVKSLAIVSAMPTRQCAAHLAKAISLLVAETCPWCLIKILCSSRLLTVIDVLVSDYKISYKPGLILLNLNGALCSARQLIQQRKYL